MRLDIQAQILNNLSAQLQGIVSRGIKEAEIDESGHLIFTLTDDSTVDLGKVVGDKGDKGDKGDRGEQGIQGIQGEQGPQGVQGERGPQGETGPQGERGEQGETGEQGPQGIQGEAGPQGEKGDTGEQGPQGEQGIQGPQGEQGPQGAQGPQGIQGIQGERGEKGDPGAGLQIAGEVDTYADLPTNLTPDDAGKAYIVRADSKLYVWTGTTFPPSGQGSQFVGPQGPKGDKGDPGEDGTPGAKGDKGDTGEQGPQGLQGIQGPKGDTGATGTQGPQGIQGPKGETGETGAQGPKGDPGAKGDTGSQGPQGNPGADGYTPVRGTDYWTASDKAEIVSSASAAVIRTNPNLLDNWYFGNPVNQRGFTSATGSGYCIDRWVISKTNASTVASVALAPGVIQLTNTDADADRYIEIIQHLEETVCSAISNRTATFSILTDRGLITFTDTLTPDSYRSHSAGNVTLYMRVNTGGTANVRLRLYSGTALSVYAAKMELGTQQTLAHQEDGVWVLNEIPDYGEQLRRCQRYFITLNKTGSYNSSMLYGFNTGGNTIALQIPCAIRDASAYTATITGTLYLKNSSQSTVVFDGTETVSVTQNFPYIVLTASKTGTGGSGGAANSDGLRIVVSADL